MKAPLKERLLQEMCAWSLNVFTRKVFTTLQVMALTVHKLRLEKEGIKTMDESTNIDFKITMHIFALLNILDTSQRQLAR